MQAAQRAARLELSEEAKQRGWRISSDSPITVYKVCEEKFTSLNADDVVYLMQLNAEDYDNPTALAEACAHEFDHDEWLDNDTHEVWDHALEFKPVN